MILFYEDWAKYPSAIPDTKTKNRSFVRQAGIYKKMGIKNHMFLLALHNPLLQGIDPHDKSLSLEYKVMIAEEVKINPWYFFREVLRVPPPAGNTPIALKANRANISTLWLAFNHVTNYLIQIRQTGKSLIGNALDAYALNCGANNTELFMLTKDDKLRAKTSRDIRELIELLPDYLQMMSKKDIKNSERITVRNLKNVLNIFVGQKDKKAADNLGRGLTIPTIRIDEFAYIYNIEISLPVILTASTAARDAAKDADTLYYTIFTTTPGKLNSPDGRFAYSIYNNSVRWSEKFYDSENIDELNDIIKKHSGSGYKVVLSEFNHMQLGYDNAWLRDRMEIALSKGEDAESDFLNIWINGNSSSPIPKKILDIIVSSKRVEANTQITKNGYIINWYVNNNDLKYIKQNRFLVIGLDTSDALGGKNDAIGLVIRDSITGAVIGTGKYNEINLSTFADFLVSILEEYPKSVLIPERKSSATAIMDNMFRLMLVKRINPFKRIFNKIVQNASDKNDVKIKDTTTKIPSLEVLTKNKRSFGFVTAGSGENARDLLYGNVFRSSVTYTADKVYDKTLISQLSGLKIVNNRLDHESGEHDDMAIAWLLGYYLLQYGKNTEVYGLPSNMKLNNVIDNELLADNPDVDNKKIKEQILLKEQIDYYINKLRLVSSDIKPTNVILAKKIYSKLQYVNSKIDHKIITNVNIDMLLKDIKIFKQLNKKRNVYGNAA